MKIEETSLPGVLKLTPTVHRDERGFFYESYRTERFEAAIGRPLHFEQDSHSRSERGVLRGLHLQGGDDAQGKLVRVTRGRAFDVAVDLRPNSPHFGRWAGAILDEEMPQCLWIPPGFAHGFLAIGDGTEVQYKSTRGYAPASERVLAWDDPEVAIEWPFAEWFKAGEAPQLSPKDRTGEPLAAFRPSGFLE